MEKATVPDLFGRIIPPMPQFDYFMGKDEVPFPDPGGEFSLAASWWFSEAAQIGYEEPNFVANVMRFAGFPRFRFFHNKSTEAFVVHRPPAGKKPGSAIVIFRGTELKSPRALMDLYTDASFTKETLNGGIVHRGFKDGLMLVWEGKGERVSSSLAGGWTYADGLRPYLDGLAAEGVSDIYLTGHSLGAALATVAASQYPKAAALYTYGSPMVGDAAFAASIKVPCYRWAHGRDLVTHIPPPDLMEKILKYAYVHCGELHYIDADGKIRSGPEDQGFTHMVMKDFNKIMEGLSAVFTDAFSSIENVKKAIKSIRAERRRRKVADLPFVDTLLDHAPAQYSVKIWNLLCD
jgi:hypothetical protein